jgi:hypothetical protein
MLEIRPHFLQIVYNFYVSFLHSILCNQNKGYKLLKFFYKEVDVGDGYGWFIFL